MPSLKYRSARTEPLAPLGFGSHKLDDVPLYLCRRNAFREGMLAFLYGSRILFQQPRISKFKRRDIVVCTILFICRI